MSTSTRSYDIDSPFLPAVPLVTTLKGCGHILRRTQYPVNTNPPLVGSQSTCRRAQERLRTLSVCPLTVWPTEDQFMQNTRSCSSRCLPYLIVSRVAVMLRVLLSLIKVTATSRWAYLYRMLSITRFGCVRNPSVNQATSPARGYL